MPGNRINDGFERRHMVHSIGIVLNDQQVKTKDSELEDPVSAKASWNLLIKPNRRTFYVLGNRQCELHAGGCAANTVVRWPRWGDGRRYPCSHGCR